MAKRIKQSKVAHAPRGSKVRVRVVQQGEQHAVAGHVVTPKDDVIPLEFREAATAGASDSESMPFDEPGTYQLSIIASFFGEEFELMAVEMAIVTPRGESMGRWGTEFKGRSGDSLHLVFIVKVDQ